MFRHNRYTRHRLAVMPLFILIALPLPVAHFQAQQREQQMRQVMPAAKRAVSLCTALSEDCQAIGQPVLLEMSPIHSTSEKSRRAWRVECMANGRAYMLHVNASTGRLCSLFAQERTPLTRFTEPSSPLIDTPEEAVEASVTLLRRLELVSEGGKIALSRSPVFLPGREVWQIAWNVRRPDFAQPGQIKVELDKRSGVPVLILDTQALSPIM